MFVCLYCVNNRWSAWVVRVGAPQNIFKPHSQISRLGMWTICLFIFLLPLLVFLLPRLFLLPCLFLVTFALLVLLPCLFFLYHSFTRVGGLMNNIRGWALDFCVYCMDSRWSTWVVRVGAPSKIFKPHSQI